jgi:hypothetical protein
MVKFMKHPSIRSIGLGCLIKYWVLHFVFAVTLVGKKMWRTDLSGPLTNHLNRFNN